MPCLLLRLAHLFLKSLVDNMGLKVGVAFRRIGADDNDLFYHVMASKTLAPELHMDLAPAAGRYSALRESGISTTA